MDNWGDRVHEKVQQYGDLVLGIDPETADIPGALLRPDGAALVGLERYVSLLLEIAQGHIGIVKFQSAFFEAYGSGGVAVLARSIKQAKDRGYLIILDAKRGDIGTTAAAYARAYLTSRDAGCTSDLEVDCLTVNPFLGPDSLAPFVECAKEFGKGLFILAKTSNPSAAWLQEAPVGQRTLSEELATLIHQWGAGSRTSSGLSSIGAVVGATFPHDASRLRRLMPNALFLVPGMGPQGGKSSSANAFRRAEGGGALFPMSRGITRIETRDISVDEFRALILRRLTAMSAAIL